MWLTLAQLMVVLAGPDCFRHYEMMAEGNIVLVPDTSSLRSFMDGLPVFFMGTSGIQELAVSFGVGLGS